MDAWLASETTIRLSCFALVLAAMAGLEALLPRRPRALPRARRWPSNLGVVALNALALRLVFPTTAIAAALAAEASGIGLLPWLALPYWLAVILAVILLDLAIYLQHVLFHAVPSLWRLHRMHHADLDFDVTTGVRFHPVEIILSMALKLMVVTALGAPALAVLVFEVLLNATAMFNHSNLRLPLRLDAALRLVLVTPDMHRVHHSTIRQETDSNYGFNLALWDRLFATYRAQPALGHDDMEIGVEGFRDPDGQRIDRMLVQPLKDGK